MKLNEILFKITNILNIEDRPFKTEIYKNPTKKEINKIKKNYNNIKFLFLPPKDLFVFNSKFLHSSVKNNFFQNKKTINGIFYFENKKIVIENEKYKKIIFKLFNKF